MKLKEKLRTLRKNLNGKKRKIFTTVGVVLEVLFEQ